MKKKRKKRILSFVLTLILCLGMTVPVYAYDNGTFGQANIISAGNNHTAVIDAQNNLWVWGSNRFGEIGNNGQGDQIKKHFYSNGEKTYPVQTRPVMVMSNVTSVSCGDGFTAAIKDDGTLWAWGNNLDGQLGNGGAGNSVGWNELGYSGRIQTTPVKIMNNVVAVSCGFSHAFAIQADGSLWGWGHNLYGQIGNGGSSNDAWYSRVGKEIPIQTIPVKVMDNVRSVCCADFCTVAVKMDGTLWIWGDNSIISEQANSPMILKDGVADAWIHMGYRLYFRNIDNTIGTFDDSSLVPITTDVSSVALFERGTAFLKTDGSLWMNGDTYMQGEEGYQMFKDVSAKRMDNVAAVSVSSLMPHAVVIRTDGSVWCWGSNNDGEIGNGINSPDNKSTDLMQYTPYMVEGILAKLP